MISCCLLFRCSCCVSAISYSWHVLWTLIELYTKITKLFQNKGNHTKISMRWSLGRNAFWLWLKGGLIVYFHVRSCSLSYVSRKTCTTFYRNTYVFFKNHNRVFKVLILSNLYICAICIPYCILLLPRRNTHCLYKSG